MAKTYPSGEDKGQVTEVVDSKGRLEFGEAQGRM
jgi:hypothetical protein